MDTQKQIQLLQVVYAGVLADAVLQLTQEGVLDNVVSRKREEQLAGGQTRAAQMGMTTPEEAFTKTVELFRCANWTIAPNDTGFNAEATACMLCGLAKKMGADSPCQLYCLNPLEGMVKGLSPAAKFITQETLWTGKKCRVEVKR